MAAGFKQATVNAASVPSTQTDFPSYVDLSRLGITTLAEAQSVRVYADSAKTTEWAREIVNLTEMHVKVPSLTNSVVMYVDWDGVRADYGTGTSFGRNAVWSTYSAVFHMEGGNTDSSGNKTPSTTGSVSFAAAGKLAGLASETAGSAGDYISTGATFATGNTAKSFSLWFYWDTPSTNRGWLLAGGTDSNGKAYGAFVQSVAGLFFHGNGGTFDITLSTGITASTWYHLAVSYSPSTNRPYLNATAGTTNSNALNTASSTIRLHLRQNAEATSRYDGRLDEVRIRETTTMAADWITTEYNNHNAESTFWGTWTTVAGATTVNLYTLMGVGS